LLRSLEQSGPSSKQPVLWERLQNLLLGATILFWPLNALLRLDGRPSPSALLLLGLNIIVGLLLIVRRPQQKRASTAAILLALPSVAVGLLTYRLAPPFETWPWYAHGFLCAGAAIALAAFVTLGRNFAILPGLRYIVTGGLYRIVRHPAYAGQLLIAAACFAAAPSLLTLVPLALSLPFVIVRIYAEELLLRTAPEYARYVEQVHWRLLPGVW